MNNMAGMANMNMAAMGGPGAGPMMINGGMPPQPVQQRLAQQQQVQHQLQQQQAHQQQIAQQQHQQAQQQAQQQQAQQHQAQQQQAQQQQQQQQPQDQRVLLNTYIYEYFLRNEMWDCARAILESGSQLNVKKESPGRGSMGNGINDDAMDTDSKDALDHKRPDGLPEPNMPGCVSESCFLYEWFSLFWSMFSHQKGSGPLQQQVSQYVQHTQQQSRLKQEQQRDMLRQMRPQEYQQQPLHMVKMPNGMIRMPHGSLQRTAMANNTNPQAMQMLQQQKPGQMQRDPSDMDGNRARPGSPASADNAPSPSKRPRLDNNAPFNQNPAVMMGTGRPQGMPGQPQVGLIPDSIRAPLLQNGLNPNTLNPDQLQAFASAPNAQAKSLAMYSANLQQHHGNQMPNKPPMANAVGPQGQGSPMVSQNPGGTDIAQFYNQQDIAGQGNMRQGNGTGQSSAGSNHALQDYQMQLMLLEQQNKKRLMMARQEQETLPPRDGAPGGPGGPNGGGFQGTSPPGGRNGNSPNPAEQMKRNAQQMANAVGIGSPLPDGAQSRSSPNNIGGFIGQPNMEPHNPQFMNIQATQMNGQVRMQGPHGPHPQFPNGQMSQQQMMAQRQQQQAAQQQQQNAQGGGPGMQWQPGGPNGQMSIQGGQPQVQGTPTQTQRSMPPPQAPSAVPAANVVNSRNATSSPQVTTANPPTPSQGNKAAPKKKADGKKKTAAAKKAGANLNTTGSTPVAEIETQQEAPTPATPITPVNPTNFAKNNNVNVNPGQIVQNPGQPIPPPPQAPAVQAPQHPDMFNMDGGIVSPRMAHSNFGSAYTNQQDFPLGFADPASSSDVLNDFDFDSFLHDGTNGEDNGGFNFGDGGFMDDQNVMSAAE
ncbi:hypothetical protein QBC38DRAFT_59975 [Podospora fimiseda]|uniref:LisH domain-containing protein n=1 Tax=Podospora fimiseda TaxID=252190 RepID=A0AAN7BGV9_9PEZI|nr:hypothetical protein QBC38DRAFT_59975 [Podospora fimiseda]